MRLSLSGGSVHYRKRRLPV